MTKDSFLAVTEMEMRLSMFGKKKEEKFKQILELIEIIKVQFQKYSELKDGKTELENYK